LKNWLLLTDDIHTLRELNLQAVQQLTANYINTHITRSCFSHHSTPLVAYRFKFRTYVH